MEKEYVCMGKRTECPTCSPHLVIAEEKVYVILTLGMTRIDLVTSFRGCEGAAAEVGNSMG